jgi:iron(III) transport system ATP-binding protein
MTTESAIALDAVDKSFGRAVALLGLSLRVEDGEFHTILGPSGCGKTTALRVIAGFETPDRGTVSIKGSQVAGPGIFVAPENRRVGMVFQEFALFPHLNVAANIGYGVGDPTDRRRRVAELLGLVGMTEYESRFPHELSGGEQQRVAVARALAPRPRVILLDEPFSNLDASLRVRVRNEIKEILKQAQTTVLFVTHDQEEALSLSDRVSVMREGTVVQAGTPAALYRRPADAWTARFLGDADFLTARAEEGSVRTPYGSFPSDATGDVEVMVRPESVVLFPGDDAQVIKREFFGHDQLVTVELSTGTLLRSRLGPSPELSIGARVGLKINDAVVYPAEPA